MLADDLLGATRETYASPLPPSYHTAFEAIEADPNNELVVALLAVASHEGLKLSLSR